MTEVLFCPRSVDFGQRARAWANFLEASMKEIWKRIDGFDHYKISNFGHVKRCIQNNRNGSSFKKPAYSGINGKMLKPTTWAGYFRVNLSNNLKPFAHSIANLVAKNFIGHKSKGLTINHKDGNKLNNHVNNLEYIAMKDNIRHAYKNGLMCIGEDRPTAKLTNKKVLKIRKMYATKIFTNIEIAKKFNISISNIFRIVHRQMWKHI